MPRLCAILPMSVRVTKRTRPGSERAAESRRAGCATPDRITAEWSMANCLASEPELSIRLSMLHGRRRKPEWKVRDGPEHMLRRMSTTTFVACTCPSLTTTEPCAPSHRTLWCAILRAIAIEDSWTAQMRSHRVSPGMPDVSSAPDLMVAHECVNGGHRLYAMCALGTVEFRRAATARWAAEQWMSVQRTWQPGSRGMPSKAGHEMSLSLLCAAVDSHTSPRGEVKAMRGANKRNIQ